MAGLSRPKDGVLSHAYGASIHVFLAGMFCTASWPGLARSSRLRLSTVMPARRGHPRLCCCKAARRPHARHEAGHDGGRQYANATHHPASAIQHSLMAGHSRPKDGVLSHAYVPASQITDSHFKQPRPNSQSNSHASSPVLFGEAPGRPVFPLSPLKDEGDGAPRGATIVLDVPAFPLGNTGRRSARHPDKLAQSGLICGVFLTAPGRAFRGRPQCDGLRQPAPGGRLLLAARRSPGAARVRALRGTPAGAASDPTPLTPHESAPRWIGRIGLYSP